MNELNKKRLKILVIIVSVMVFVVVIGFVGLLGLNYLFLKGLSGQPDKESFIEFSIETLFPEVETRYDPVEPYVY